MNNKMPYTPLSTPLSGSAQETELRLKNIFSGPKKRPPLPLLALMCAVCLLCGNLVSCQMKEELPPPDLSVAPVDWDKLTEPDPTYALEENGDVLIEGLEGAYAEWNRRSAGDFLYFAGDPAFCCPSLAGRMAEGSARWQDEPWSAVVVDMSINDDRLENGTISGFHLQFTADWSKETVLESSFTSEIGDGTLELSEKEILHAGWILYKLMNEAGWTATADVTILDVSPDLNRNGVPEEVRLIVPASYGSGQQLEIWEDGQQLWKETGDEAHVGWNALFLCALDGEDYLLRYNPWMGQGLAGYSYELFTLEGGGEKVVRENELFFEVNFGMPTPEGGVADPDDIFDPDAIADFMEEVNGLLAHSVQLLNTDKELLSTFESEGRLMDTLFFLYNEPEVFTPDPEASLRENLWDYRDAMVQRTR